MTEKSEDSLFLTRGHHAYPLSTVRAALYFASKIRDDVYGLLIFLSLP